MNRSAKTFAVLLTLILWLCGGAASAGYEQLPELLHVRQHTENRSNENRKHKIARTYPDTANVAVNLAVAEMVDRLAEVVEPMLPAKVKYNAQADTGATIRVTGTRTASFLVFAHAMADHEQLHSVFETAVFDLETAKRMTLDDFFDTGADELIRQEVREQLNAYFPDESADEAVLKRLCDEIRQAPFTLSPAYLIFHYQASDLYEGKTTLMHVRIPYRRLTGWMTEYAKQELDNSGYYLAALTFDDGPGRGVTSSMLILLREWGAVGTFFNLGTPMRNAHDYVAWEHDAGHAVQSHTYTHTIGLDNQEKMYKERDRFAREQTAIIGIAPTYMRAPGGLDKLYCKYDIGMPVIRWNTLTGDAVQDKPVDPDACISTMVYTLKDSAIILMHNIRNASVEVATKALDRLDKRGYLTVTVDELFEIRGIEMEKNVVYYGNEADQQE